MYTVEGTNVSRKENFLHRNGYIHKVEGFRENTKTGFVTSGTGHSVRTGSILLLGALYLCISILKDVIFKIILVLKLTLLTLKTSRAKAFSPVSGEDVLSYVSPLTQTINGNSTLCFLSCCPFCSLLKIYLQASTCKWELER